MKRILHELKITEISGVDRPCQEGARVAILKAAPSVDLDLLKLRCRIVAQSIKVLATKIRSL